jgi:hypothetical protein
MESMQTRHFDCRCGHFDHLMRMTLDPDTGDIWFELRMNHYHPWWKRVVVALAYVLKRPSGLGHFAETQLLHADTWRLQKLLADSVACREEWAAREASRMAHEKPVLKG